MMRANRSPCSFKKSDKSEDESESHSSLFTKRAKKQFTLLKRGEERFALFCKKNKRLTEKPKRNSDDLSCCKVAIVWCIMWESDSSWMGICSFAQNCSLKKSDCERFALIALYKRANMSESLLSLFTKEWLWAKCCCCSLQKNDVSEWCLSLVNKLHVSDLLMIPGLGIRSSVFRANHAFFVQKLANERFAQKNERFTHLLIFGERPERFAHNSSFPLSDLSE